MCDTPTKAECDHEDLVDRAKKALRKEWDDTRGGKLYDRATGLYDAGHWIIRLLERNLDAYIYDNLEYTMGSISEADEEARDPYGSRGLTRSMFM